MININFSDLLRSADWYLTDLIKYNFHLQCQVIPICFFGWLALKTEVLRWLETSDWVVKTASYARRLEPS